MKQIITVLRKYPIFFILIALTNIKIHKAKFEAGCSYNVFDQFVL